MDSTATPRRLAALIVAVSLASSAIASLVTVALFGGTTPSTSTAPPTSTAAANGELASATTSDPVVGVAAKVRPAVVTISTSTTTVGPFGVPTTAVGSGFIIDAEGLILTNAHVVEGADEVTVTLEDGRELQGSVVASDADLDLAVVKVEATGLTAVELGTAVDLQVGQLVVAIGSPLGEFTDTVTSGILSAVGRTVTVSDAQTRTRRTVDGLLQTDAAINEGNSGGPLLDATGRVIGINTAAVTNAEGLGFAIPIDRAADLIAGVRG
jgi:S1-C subfamily serine protease